MREEKRDRAERVTRHSGTRLSEKRADHARHERVRAFDDEESYRRDGRAPEEAAREREADAARAVRDHNDKRDEKDGDAPKSAAKKEKKKGGDPDRFAHQVIPYILFWVALFAGVSFFLRDILHMGDSAGSFGNWFADLLCGLLGVTAYALPLLMVILSFRWKKLVKGGLLLKKLLLGTLFLCLLSAIIHVFQDSNRAVVETAAGLLYVGGMDRVGGGLAGGFLGEWMGKLVRLPGTCLLAMPLLLIVSIYLVGLTPNGLWQRITYKLAMMRDKYRKRKEEIYDGAEEKRVKITDRGGKEEPAKPSRPVAGESAVAPRKEGKAPVPPATEVSEWREPRPVKRSNEPRRYEFRETEQTEAEALARRRRNEAAAEQTMQELIKRQEHTRTVLATAKGPAVSEKPTAPKTPGDGARTILGEAGTPPAEERLDAILTDVLGGVNMISYRQNQGGAARPAAAEAPRTVAAEAVPRDEKGESTYYAPFALPVRPEPKREPKERDTSHIVIKPHPVAPAQEQVTESRAEEMFDPFDEQNKDGSIEEILGQRDPREEPFVTAPAEEPPFDGMLQEEPLFTDAASKEPLPAKDELPAESALEEGEILTFGGAISFDDEPRRTDAPAPTLSFAMEDEDVLDATQDVIEEDEEPLPREPISEEMVFAYFARGKEPTGEAEPVEDRSEPAAPAPDLPPEREAQRPISIVMADKPQVITSLIEEDPSIVQAELQPVREYRLPPIKLLNEDKNEKSQDHTEEMLEKAEILRETLASFNVRVKDRVECSRGPAITRYELRPEAGISVRSVINRIDDISLNMAAPVRIEAPIPGKPAIGIEVPNAVRETVFMRTMLESEVFTDSKKPLEVPLGLGIGGDIQMCNLASMPHLLVAGTTGSGKSVCINTILISLMYKVSPADLRLILIDPKQVEFAAYAHVPHLYAPIVTESPRAVGVLACAVQEMERRYSLIKDVGMRDIDGYNEVTKDDPEREHLPRMVIVIDEFADLKMSCPNNDAENHTCRLAQKARAAGIHLIIGTQRPSVDVITGKLKNNIPSRIAFTVKQQVDSRTILDTNGAESLTGKGDMLYMPVGCQKPIRVQGAFVSDGEVERVITYIRDHNEPVQYNQAFMDQIEAEMARANSNGRKGGEDFDDIDDGDDSEDPKFREAVALAIETQKVATSLLQRRLGVGYGRAAKLIDRMEALGYVSAPEGNKARKVLITQQEYMAQLMNGEEPDGGDFTDEFN